MTHKRLGFMQLAIICGFSLFYAYYLISFFGLFLLAPQFNGFAELHLGQIVLFLASIVTTSIFLAQFRRADSVAIGHARFLFLASLIPGSALPGFVAASEMGALLPLPLFYVACAFTGISIGIGFMLWEDLSTHGYLRRGVLAHGVIFCAGGVVFLAGSFLLPKMGSAIVAELCLCASTALLAFITPRCDTIENMPVKPACDYFNSSRHLDVVVAVLNMAFGYAFIMLYLQDQYVLLTAMGIAIAADLCFSVAFGRGRWMPFAGAVRICVAVVSCALILFSCLADGAENVALCLIVVLWFIFRTINGGSLTDRANRQGFSALYTGSRGKLAANIGFTLGIALGVMVAVIGATVVTKTYAPLALVAAFIMTSLFLLPSDAESSNAGFKTLALVDMHESRDATMDKVCQNVAKQFKLSPRETEVLGILVKGRNAKYISEKLFISESTAKTHISNVYRKTGVHSQQELLDAIENMS